MKVATVVGARPQFIKAMNEALSEAEDRATTLENEADDAAD